MTGPGRGWCVAALLAALTCQAARAADDGGLPEPPGVVAAVLLRPAGASGRMALGPIVALPPVPRGPWAGETTGEAGAVSGSVSGGAAAAAPADQIAQAPGRSGEPAGAAGPLSGTDGGAPTVAVSGAGGGAADPVPAEGGGAVVFDIGTVGEILRQRLAEAAEAGIVVFRDDPQRTSTAAQATAVPDVAAPDPRAAAPVAEPAPAAASASAPLSEDQAPGHVPAAVGPATADHAVPEEVAAPVPVARADATPANATPAGTTPAIATPANATPAGTPNAAAGPQVPRAADRPREQDMPAMGHPAAPVTVARAEPHCVPDALLTLPVEPASAGEALIQARRTMLLGEFDRPDPAAVAAAARLYLAAGLGVEAAGLGQLFLDGGPEAQVIESLSALIESRVAGLSGLLARPGCGGAHGLWRGFALALAGRSGEAMSEIGTAPAVLEALPAELRGRISATLAGAALDAGQPDRAAWFRAMAARSRDPHPETAGLIALVDARLMLAEGRLDDGLAALSGVIEGGGTGGVRAAHVLAGLGPGLAIVAPGVIEVAADLLGAEALVARGAPEGGAALRAEATLEARTKGRGAALSLLSHGLQRGLIAAGDYADALAGLDAEEGAEIAGQPLALLHAEAPERFDAALTHPAFRRALALSYAEIGTPVLAQGVLEPQDLDDAQFRAALIRAAAPYRDPAVEAWLVPAEPLLATAAVAGEPSGAIGSDGPEGGAAAMGLPPQAASTGTARPPVARLAAAPDATASGASASPGAPPEVGAGDAVANQTVGGGTVGREATAGETAAGETAAGETTASGTTAGEAPAGDMTARIDAALEMARSDVDRIRRILGDG